VSSRQGKGEGLAAVIGEKERTASTNAEWILAHLGCLYLATRQMDHQS
jgi:hypothetical protein